MLSMMPSLIENEMPSSHHSGKWICMRCDLINAQEEDQCINCGLSKKESGKLPFIYYKDRDIVVILPRVKAKKQENKEIITNI